MRSGRRAWRSAILAGALACAGCVTGGTPAPVTRPAPPAQWSAATSAAPVDRTALSTWWTTFNDPVLTRLVERAVKGNLDVRTALSRVRQARAGLAATETSRRPTVNASGSATVTRSSGEAGGGSTQDMYQAGFDASWEADLFGRVRASIAQASATAQAREMDLQDALVTLVADVASDYVSVRSLQQRLAIAEANAKSQDETFDLTRFRAQAGLTTELDVQQAKSNVESTRATISALEGELAQAKHALAVLLGQPPAALDTELAAAGPIPAAPLTVAVGVPADTLRRRPDVRSAERAVAAQVAQVQVTTAGLYPTLKLAGSIGLETLSIAKLFVPGARFWSAGPTATWQAFDRKQIRQNIVVQTELQEQAVVTYEGKVLTALQEVEDDMVALAKEQARRDHLATAADASRRAADLSLQLYSSGLKDFRDVLDAQRSQLTLEESLASSQTQVTTDLIKLFKALGGGWTPAG